MRYSIFAVMLFVSLYYAYKTELTVLFSLQCEVLTSICVTHLLKNIHVVMEPKRSLLSQQEASYCTISCRVVHFTIPLLCPI